MGEMLMILTLGLHLGHCMSETRVVNHDASLLEYVHGIYMKEILVHSQDVVATRMFIES